MHCQRQGHKKCEHGREVEPAGATKSNQVVSTQTHMRRVNLGNMFAPQSASGWINQFHAQTLSPITYAKTGKVFHETCQTPQGARGNYHFSGALRCPAVAVAPHVSAPRRAAPIYGKRSNISYTQ